MLLQVYPYKLEEEEKVNQKTNQYLIQYQVENVLLV
jgi:hypothetical protein